MPWPRPGPRAQSEAQGLVLHRERLSPLDLTRRLSEEEIPSLREIRALGVDRPALLLDRVRFSRKRDQPNPRASRDLSSGKIREAKNGVIASTAGS